MSDRAARISCEVTVDGLPPQVISTLARSIGGIIHVNRMTVATGTGSSGGTEVYLPSGGIRWTVVIKNTGSAHLLVRYEPADDSATFTGFSGAVQNEVLEPAPEGGQGDVCILTRVDGEPDTLSGEILLYSHHSGGEATIWMVQTA